MNLYFSTSLSIESIEGFHLLQDHIGTPYSHPWNDYDYIVKFKLYYVTPEQRQIIGYLRILVNGYDDTSKFFLEKGKKVSDKTYDINGLLDISETVSLPLEIDFYAKLNKTFNESVIDELLSSLSDASYFYSEYDIYRTWPGFSGSIMREGTAAEAILKKGHQIAIGRYAPKKEFSIKLEGLFDFIEPIEFHFDNSRKIGRSNINLLIGKNGVGKTLLLKKLSEIITGISEIDEKWPYFHKLIVVAYSPFEDFYTKDFISAEFDRKYSSRRKARKIKGKNKYRFNVNEYAYVGFRKDNGEFDLNWPKEHSVESIIKILKYDKENRWWHETPRLHTLINTLSLCINFDSIAINTKNSEDLFTINKDSEIDLDSIEKSLSKEKGISFIKNGEKVNLSSGQMIYSYIIPAIVAEIEDESLLILDEPEIYLHPQLEVELINMLKYLLSETSSNAIIATHSAIMAREVERRSVTILRHNNKITTSCMPSFETYGASVELILGEVFDDYITTKPFQDDLDKLIQDKDPKHVLESIGADIGDDALAYIASMLSNDDKLTFEGE